MTPQANQPSADVLEKLPPYGLYALPQKEINRIRSACRTAEKKGILVRPTHCPECGKEALPAKDGRSTMHAHHHNGYENPLDIQWLCASCHRKDTPHRVHRSGPHPGERNPKARLREVQVLEIRRSTLSKRRLAKIYGVARSTIHSIKTGQTWAFLKPEDSNV